MTDEKRCEPPGLLRGSDGEYFVCGPNGVPFVALWHAAPHAGIEPLWHNAARTSTGTPAWAANEWGWRYVAPVTPPATVRALVEALEAAVECGMVPTSSAADGGANRFVRQVHVADQIRAALAAYRGQA